MQIKNISITNYKSIKENITISLVPQAPTVLIGKNGSGKTNILEAISKICLSNKNRLWGENTPFSYEVRIGLSKDDINKLFPNIVYDKSKSELTAYNNGNGLAINTINSPYIIPMLHQEVEDVRDMAKQLSFALKSYEELFESIGNSRGYHDSPVRSFSIVNYTGVTTDYDIIKYQVSFTVEQVKKILDEVKEIFTSEENTLQFLSNSYPIFYTNDDLKFKLNYVKPNLAPFENKFITIDEEAIKAEIEKINQATESVCDEITALYTQLTERTKRIYKAIETKENYNKIADDKYFSFLQEIQETVGAKFVFLKNENNDIIFKKQVNHIDHLNERDSNVILDTYLRNVYEGENRDELLTLIDNNKTIILNEQAVIDFEQYLNNEIPTFEQGMYQSIKVEQKEKQIYIYLIENSGEIVDINETSSGRRWYFTYYFMKSTLKEGDFFIIDEPANMLHPFAQKEILGELEELSKQGVYVIYSTHSPYLIPKEWTSVHFITMDSSTNVTCDYEVSRIKDELGIEDIFDLQLILENYQNNRGTYAKMAYSLIHDSEIFGKSIKERIENASKQLFVSEDTIKSWNRPPKKSHFRAPELINFLSLCKLLKLNSKSMLIK